MKYLFIGAHTDDLELCCGGTIAQLIEQNHSVMAVSLSHLYDDFKVDTVTEFVNSMKVLGCSYFQYEFETRNFDISRHRILQTIIDLAIEYLPNFIFTHSANDLHQDHKVVGEESLRAFKKCNLITYAGEWNLLQSESNYYIEVSEENMAKKLEAMACYKSQQHRPYFDRQFTYSRALLNGAKIGVKYAEAFKIVNLKG